MKILVVHNRYVHGGGEDAVVASEIKLLQDNGYKVVAYTRTNTELSGMNALAITRLLWSKKTYRELTELIACEQPDIAHFHNPFYMMTPSAYQACYDQKVPVVQSLHNYRFLCANGVLFRDGDVCEECLSGGLIPAVRNRCVHGSFLKSAIGSLILRSYKKHQVLSKRICGFIAPSEFCKEMYCRYVGIDTKKIYVKPHFVEDPGVSDETGSYALYAGALRDYKGIHILLDAWKKIQDLPLKIIGKEIPGFHKGSQGNVQFLGEQTMAQTIDVIKKSLCVIVPSICYETFARVIIEAYACGKPVIASNIGALAERVIDKTTGFLFQPRDPKGLAQRVRMMQENADITQVMGANARRIYEQHYQPFQNYRQLEDVYKKVMDKST